MNHTTESLLALTKSPEGLEKLRIIAAQFDGLRQGAIASANYTGAAWFRISDESPTSPVALPNYPTSLDAIFATEERLGLHDRNNGALRQEWYIQASCLIEDLDMEHSTEDFAFLTAAQRTVIFILTAQWKEQNP